MIVEWPAIIVLLIVLRLFTKDVFKKKKKLTVKEMEELIQMAELDVDKL